MGEFIGSEGFVSGGDKGLKACFNCRNGRVRD